MAEDNHTPLSSQLWVMAAELDALADQIEQQGERRPLEDA
jgi:hypothetical protein